MLCCSSGSSSPLKNFLKPTFLVAETGVVGLRPFVLEFKLGFRTFKLSTVCRGC